MLTLSLKPLIWEFQVVIFGRQRERIVLTCMAHVHTDYFSSFNQSLFSGVVVAVVVAVVLA